MTKQNQQPQTQEEQGTGVEMKYLLDSYMQQTMELTKENMMLKAYISQTKSKEAAQSGTPENVKGQPAN